ncbi:hypothetical protein PENSPDRAFT_442646 [Peniophora sp. CONT]|nr:hypothetical protein PENSPDRAFT_442646 [Peniophora sp. CONT]
MVIEDTALSVTNGLWNIPPELLARVEEYLDKGSLISYISCCKTLRATGVRTLLSAYPVMLSTYADVRSFCEFMHTDLSRRKSFLRSLTLDTPYPSPKAVLAQRARLAHALINAPNLSQLEIGRCLKDILERSSALFSAIQSLPSLKALNMEPETGSWPYVILRLHNAPITALEMGYLGIDTPDAFTRHASTLQELSVGARFHG